MAPTTEMPTDAELAERRANYLAGLLWHVGAFVIVNAALWLLDLALGDGGLDWAVWITAIWGFALAFHVLAYLIDGRQLVARKTRQYLRELDSTDGGTEP
jgi:hypothetical protein